MTPLLLRRAGLRRPAAVVLGAGVRAVLGAGVRVVLGAGVTATLLAACGQTTRVGPSRTLQVALTEYHVAPQSVAVRTGTLSIYVHNYGRLTHNLVISTGGRPLASTQPIPPGQTTELIAPLGPGRYLMSSTILSDQALGAYGTLTVTR